MTHLPIMRWVLVAILPLGALLVGLLRAVIRHVTLFSIEETLVGVLGALVFMGVLLGVPQRGVCWPLCC